MEYIEYLLFNIYIIFNIYEQLIIIHKNILENLGGILAYYNS